MNIKDGYASKKVTFGMQGSLDDKIERLTSMMSKLTAQDDNQNKQFKSKIYQRKQRGQTRNFYDWNNYDQRNIKIYIGLIAYIGDHHIEIEVSMDKITEKDSVMLIIIEMMLEKTILGKHKITESKFIEVDTVGIIEMIFLKEVGVGLIDNI